MLTPWKKTYDKPRQHVKKQRHYFANEGLPSQSYGFPSGHVWMWELDHKESWALKNWCFWSVVLEKTLESPLDCKEIQPVHPKEINWIFFIGRTDAEAETPLLWPLLYSITWCKELTHWIWPWCWERLKAGGEGGDRGWDVGWHHWLYGHEFEQALGVGDGQGGLVSAVHGVAKSQTQVSDWTELKATTVFWDIIYP